MRIVHFAADRADDALFLVNLLRPAPIKLSEFFARDSRWTVGDLRLRWLGYEDDRAVAYGQIAISPYAPADHLAIQIAVDPDHRGCGRGSDMLDHLEREANGRGFRGLVATIPEAASHPQAWAQARGFRRHALHSDSLLDLRTFHRQADVPAEVSLTDMAEATETQWREVAALLQTLIADAPDMRDLPPWTMTRCLSVLRETPAARPDWVIIARSEGGPVGLTVGHAMGEEIYSYFTGVMPSWRGRHVGLALKLRLIGAAQAQGIVTMRTTNLDTNTPALRLNASIGFRRAPGSLELRKALSSIDPTRAC
ncbi:GNAT family N-acetyltransferase [Parvibaculum sp.]|uniref:GNAT family N-acetyltransferase n=1 Tax=Parvibaculum sp. TaxID=2024848 RepID=UPI00391BEE90